jgi:hypothetical protein
LYDLRLLKIALFVNLLIDLFAIAFVLFCLNANVDSQPVKTYLPFAVLIFMLVCFGMSLFGARLESRYREDRIMNRSENSGLFGLINKIKTPLMLAGLVVVVLYLTIKRVLELPIFPTISPDSTEALLIRVVDAVFWLAVLATILGFIGFVITNWPGQKPPRSS